MTEDIATKLVESVSEEFHRLYGESEKIQTLLKKVKNGTATYQEAHSYATEVHKLTGQAWQKFVTADTLPEGRMYYNIASRLIPSTLDENFDLVSDYAVKAQQQLNEKAKIGLKAQAPEKNQDRIDGLVQEAANAEQYADIEGRLLSGMENFALNVVDETIRANADFQYSAGLRPSIKRTMNGGACKWCAALAGTYDYPDVPHDVYRRHKNCRCIVTYDPADGSKQVQNVHTKQWTADREPDKIEERKKYGQTKPKPNSAVVKQALEDGTVEDAINPNAQARHCEANGDLSAGRSYIYGTEEDAAALYDKLKGTGEPIMDKNGVWQNKERVVNDKPIGVHVSNAGERTETSAAMIVYSKTGSHIYPRKGEP